MSTQTAIFTVPDMHCESCPKIIKMELEELPGITSVSADLTTKKVTVAYDPSKSSIDDLQSAVKKAGYTPQNT